MTPDKKMGSTARKDAVMTTPCMAKMPVSIVVATSRDTPMDVPTTIRMMNTSTAEMGLNTTI